MSNNITLLMSVVGIGLLGSSVEAAPTQSAKLKTSPSKTTKPKPTKPVPDKEDATILQQVQGDGVTIHLRRARWADSEEVTSFKRRGKQLTLWFDAVLDPATKLPEGASPTDYIVNVQAVDKNNRTFQVFPVFPFDKTPMWHRSSMGFAPAKDGLKTIGQMIWRVNELDPDSSSVKLKIEWLKPNHPFTRKTLPPSLLKRNKDADSPESKEWLQVFELDLPEQQIEIGTVGKMPPAIAEADNGRFKATLYSWTQGTGTSTYADGTQTPHRYLYARILIRAADPNDIEIFKNLEVRLSNGEGEPLRMALGRKFFSPNGKPLRAHERYLDGSVSMPPAPLADNAKWTFEIRASDNRKMRFKTDGTRVFSFEDQLRDRTASMLKLENLSNPIGPKSAAP